MAPVRKDIEQQKADCIAALAQAKSEEERQILLKRHKDLERTITEVPLEWMHPRYAEAAFGEIDETDPDCQEILKALDPNWRPRQIEPAPAPYGLSGKAIPDAITVIPRKPFQPYALLPAEGMSDTAKASEIATAPAVEPIIISAVEADQTPITAEPRRHIGRPREDAARSRIMELRKEHPKLSWQQITNMLNREADTPRTKEAVRALARTPGENPPVKTVSNME